MICHFAFVRLADPNQQQLAVGDRSVSQRHRLYEPFTPVSNNTVPNDKLWDTRQMSVNFSLINGPNGFPNPANFVNCTLEICPIITSYYNYRLNIGANAFFLAFFALALPYYVAVWFYTRRGIWFTQFMVIGLVAEIVGYAGRIISWKNQWDYIGFLIQSRYSREVFPSRALSIPSNNCLLPRYPLSCCFLLLYSVSNRSK